jgi:hypothetical protein
VLKSEAGAKEAGLRLWTIHPSYLDAVGLVAAWREGLLARKVLEGGTLGYVHHPQLLRFKGCADPRRSILKYLHELLIEARARAYSFDESKIGGFDPGYAERIAVNDAQIRYELELLKWKLAGRSPGDLGRLPAGGGAIRLNGAFSERPGPIEAWERVVEEVRARMSSA